MRFGKVSKVGQQWILSVARCKTLFIRVATVRKFPGSVRTSVQCHGSVRYKRGAELLFLLEMNQVFIKLYLQMSLVLPQGGRIVGMPQYINEDECYYM